MKTCQFNDSYFPIIDGVGMTAHNYASWLEKQNCNSFLIAPGVKDYVDDVNYQTLRFNSVMMPMMNPYRIGLPHIDYKFNQKLKSLEFDILHAHCPFVSGQLALNLSKKLDIPLVATFHSKYKEDFKKILDSNLFVKFMIQYVVNFYNSVDYVWVPNRSTGETLREYGFQGDFEIIPNGTDLEIPHKHTYLLQRNRGLLKLDCTTDDFVLLFVGQHRWEKNVRMIIESLKILKDENVKFKMVFVGEGYASKDMHRLVKQMMLKDNVIFTGPIADRTQLKQIYASADLLVFPSVYDNAPLVMIESAAYNVPAIVVKGTSAAECVLENVNGFLIDNTKESLAAKIKDLYEHPEKIKSAGKNAEKTIYRNWESIVNNVKMKYIDIIDEHNLIKSANHYLVKDFIHSGSF